MKILNGIYRGIVEDNDDPKKAGRCKVRIIGIHTLWNDEGEQTLGIKTENLPWAEPAVPIFGGISRVGIYGVPCTGANVFLFFENGNSQRPIYFATAPGLPGETPFEGSGFTDPTRRYPIIPFEPDWNSGNYSSTEKAEDKFVIQDKAGNKIEFCSESGKEGIIIEHGITHARIVIDAEGGVRNEAGKNSAESFCGEEKIYCSGDSKHIVTGDKTETTKNLSTAVFGNKTESIMGSSDVSVTGIENKKTGGLSYNIQGNSYFMSGGKASNVSDGKNLIKSNTGNVKITASKMNIEMEALLQVKSLSMTYSAKAIITASVKGQIMTSIGGGIVTQVDGIAMTKVNSSGIVMITGSLIMIG